MLCPICKVEMESHSYEGVTVDRCSKCQGVWLDYGELRLITAIRDRQFTPEELEAAMKGDSRKKEESTVICPKCDEPMEKRETHDTLIDMCPRGHGVWLDKGELERIQIVRERLEKMRPTGGGIIDQVMRFLGAMGDALGRVH